jgi:hypothetical protein
MGHSVRPTAGSVGKHSKPHGAHVSLQEVIAAAVFAPSTIVDESQPKRGLRLRTKKRGSGGRRFFLGEREHGQDSQVNAPQFLAVAGAPEGFL